MSEPTVDKYVTDRAEEVVGQFHAANETYQTHMLLAVQIVTLLDIRFHLQNVEELLRNRVI